MAFVGQVLALYSMEKTVRQPIKPTSLNGIVTSAVVLIMPIIVKIEEL